MKTDRKFKAVAFEADVGRGHRVRFIADSHPALLFHVVDSLSETPLARLAVWDANPEFVKLTRMLDTDDWSLDSEVEAEAVLLDEQGQFRRGVNSLKGTLKDVFETVLDVLAHEHKGEQR